MSKGGSFGLPAAAVQAKAREASRAEALGAPDGSVPEAAQETEADKLIKSKIPESVFSPSRGAKVPFDEYRVMYDGVWKAVASKDHLMNGGRVFIDAEVLGSAIRLRSLNAREVQFLSFWQDQAADGLEAKIEADVRSLILQIDMINGQSYPVTRVSIEKRDEWLALPHVTQLYNLLMDLDEGVLGLILNHAGDLNQAKYFALLENVRHP